MEKLRTQYPALKEFVYLNSCSSGLISETLLAYRRQLDESFQKEGSNFRAGVYQKIKAIKQTLATTFGAETHRTALIPSCSFGINLVLEAMPGSQKVLHLQDDYPSIIWPFESRDFTCVKATVQNYSKEELLRQIELHEPAILALSAVQYSNGALIAPQDFQAIKALYPDLLIMVDATQFWGVAPFDFRESGIDLFVASAFKWLCAGYGNGAMFISSNLARQLDSKIRGYNTYKNPRAEGTPTLGEYFEPGHQDLLSFQSLAFQVEALAGLGFENIQAQISRIKGYARKRIAEETNYPVLTPKNPHLESGILSIDAPKGLVKYLNQEGIVCSYNKGLRLGIHFYNNQKDIDQLIEKMQSFKTS